MALTFDTSSASASTSYTHNAASSGVTGVYVAVVINGTYTTTYPTVRYGGVELVGISIASTQQTSEDASTFVYLYIGPGLPQGSQTVACASATWIATVTFTGSEYGYHNPASTITTATANPSITYNGLRDGAWHVLGLFWSGLSAPTNITTAYTRLQSNDFGQQCCVLDYRLLVGGGSVTLMDWTASSDDTAIIVLPICVAPEISDWRFRDDNGSESTASWLANASTNITLPDADTPFRLRFAISLPSGKSNAYSATSSYQLRVGKKGTAMTSADDWENYNLFYGFGNSFSASSSIAYKRGYIGSTYVDVFEVSNLNPSGLWVSSNHMDTHYRLYDGPDSGVFTWMHYISGESKWVRFDDPSVSATEHIWTSTDLTTWTENTTFTTLVGTNPFGPLSGLNDVFAHDGTTTIFAYSGNAAQKLFYTTTVGGAWSEADISGLSAPTGCKVYYSEALSLFFLYGNSGFLATSSNGSSWTARTSGETTNNINCMGDGIGTQVLFGTSGGTVRYSSDGTSWSSASIGGGGAAKQILQFEDIVLVLKTDWYIYFSYNGTSFTQKGRTNAFSVVWWNPVRRMVRTNNNTAHGAGYYYPPMQSVSGSSSYIRSYNSSNLTDAADTTQQITSGTYNADNNGVSETGAVSTSGLSAFSANSFVEMEFALQLQAADVSVGDIFYVDLVHAGADNFFMAPALATATIEVVTPPTLTALVLNITGAQFMPLLVR